MAMNVTDLCAWVLENYTTSTLKANEICDLLGVSKHQLKNAVHITGVRRNASAGRGRNFKPSTRPPLDWKNKVPKGCELTHNGYLEKLGAKTVHRMAG